MVRSEEGYSKRRDKSGTDHENDLKAPIKMVRKPSEDGRSKTGEKSVAREEN